MLRMIYFYVSLFNYGCQESSLVVNQIPKSLGMIGIMQILRKSGLLFKSALSHTVISAVNRYILIPSGAQNKVSVYFTSMNFKFPCVKNWSFPKLYRVDLFICQQDLDLSTQC